MERKSLLKAVLAGGFMVFVGLVSRQNKVDTFPPLIKRWFGA